MSIEQKLRINTPIHKYYHRLPDNKIKELIAEDSYSLYSTDTDDQV